MADRDNHYERAFAHFLHSLRLPCIPVDESRRWLLGQVELKNLDFVVSTARERWLLVDVKGRRWNAKRRVLENWATDDDIRSLALWQERFGACSTALLAFVYELPRDGAVPKGPVGDPFELGGRRYGCLALAVGDYERHMRRRSRLWRTVHLPTRAFAELARPFSAWFERPPPEPGADPADLVFGPAASVVMASRAPVGERFSRGAM